MEEIAEEYFDIICDSIIRKMVHPKKMSLFDFRETLYDILVYNLDFTEVLWHIVVHFINEGKLSNDSLNIITKDIYSQLKQYNNNYRPIYHLEIILLNIVNLIHGYNNTEMSSNIQLKKRTNKSRGST